MVEIVIKQSKSADTRSAEKIVEKDELLKSSKQHIADVKQAIEFMRDIMLEKANNHDFTKIKFINLFHSDFKEVQTSPNDNFKSKEWFKIHVNEERHHLNDRCPEDVNLFDVLERIADITMAGLARTGSVYDDTLSTEILEKAYENTIELIKKNT